jgi:succinate CoA transferase
MKSTFPQLTAAEAAAMIRDGDVAGFSGFTPAGAPKLIPAAIADLARAEHDAGRPFQIGVITGASTGPSVDGALAKADAIKFRTPYQSDPDLRRAINAGRTRFFDMHLSMLPQVVRNGFLGKVNWAIIEASEVTADGEIVLTSAVGAAPTFCRCADKILIELNIRHPAALRGFHDIYEPADPPHRREIPIYRPTDRIGQPFIKVDPRKIVGIVQSDVFDESGVFAEASPLTTKIGENVANFLANELAVGRVPKDFLPIQSGVGDIANAVLGALGEHPGIPPFEMYSEVLQDSVLALMRAGKIRFASAVSLTLSKPMLEELYTNLESYRARLVLRPQEITNHPEVVRRLGVISINTAIEVDLFGNVNSTHILGKSMMNGIGGSGDFTRNAYISIFTCPSIQKGGAISTIVPLVSHADHSEHSVQVVVTEQGVADLRGKDPKQRAQLIIEKCVHPDYRPDLERYYRLSLESHTPQALGNAFGMHLQFLRTGSMRGAQWAA